MVLLTQHTVEGLGVPADIVHSELGAETSHNVDRLRFERIVANLVENAIRYADGVTSVGLSRRTDGALVVTVDDAGPGVPDDERIAIFGRFHRGTVQKQANAPKGTGLGLSLVEEHAMLHGGSVSVCDSPAGGARFAVVIP